MSAEHQAHCAEHGEGAATYVCGHLAENPKQYWYCDFPSEHNPWPDAWCRQCNTVFLRDGEWNQGNEDCLDLKILCHQCYDLAQAQSVDCLQDQALDSWIDTLTSCCEELQQKHQLLETQLGLFKHQRWDYDQAENLLVFSTDGVPAFHADIEFIGSVSTQSNTWLWAWANFHNLDNVRTRIKRVREFGEQQGFPRLTVPKWPADQVDGWEVASIAARILGAQGVYRVPFDDGFLFMAMLEIQGV